jgi:mannose/fructose/N-acetylgalactosamine-specific phosphotransferase system component IID
MFINPWVCYRPEDIPDLTPRSDEEMTGCLAGACGAIIATIIYVLLFYLCFTFTEGMLRPILVLIDSAVIYPILMICLMKFSFKIGDKIYKKKRKWK